VGRKAKTRFLAVVFALVGTMATLWALLERRSRGRALRRQSRLSRNVTLMRLGGTTASAYAWYRAKRIFAAAERKEELDRTFEIRTTEGVVEALGNLKGAFMKIGQMASYLDQGLPPHVRDALAQLQASAPPMSKELVDATIAAELGGLPTEVFATWDDTPIAAASIGQVHRAITHDGQAVAVKVQYPGVDKAIANDLANADMVFGAMSYLFPGLDPVPIVTELQERLVEELDYRLEAENQRRFADYYRGHPTIIIPEVLEEFSTNHVLTTELSAGVRFDEVLTWPSSERDLAAETIYRFAFGSLYRLGLFNGDPHPGNYLFEPGGKVTFLDFGLVKVFTPEELGGFEALILAIVVNPDPPKFRGIIENLGLLTPNAPISDDEVFDYFNHFYEFVRHAGRATITSEYAAQTVRHMFNAKGPYEAVMAHINVPTAFVIIQRINLGLYAIFGQLEATADWRRITEELWTFTNAAPSTPMGEAAAKWAAAKRN